MKIFTTRTLAILAGFLLVGVLAVATDSPLQPWITKIKGDLTINKYGSATLGSGVVTGANVADMSTTAATEGLYAGKIARFTYDVSANGGSVAPHTLGASLPAGAVIIRSYFKIITQFVDSGSGTVALSCEDANNIKTATDITGSSADAFVEGASTGAASAFVRGIAAACNITATVAGVAQTSGKLIGWVHYVVENL